MAAQYYCNTCCQEVEAEVDEAEGHAFCGLCGLQLEDLLFEEGPAFVKDGDGAHLAGTIIRDENLSKAGGGGFADDSRERSAHKGEHWIRSLAQRLEVPNMNMCIDRAKRVYLLAISKGFTRGRHTSHVAAACLYIVLRQEREPYMLIDFCHLLSVNMYLLGSTYLRLTEQLRLDTHPLLISAVDPSLYLHRFAGRLELPEGKLDPIVQTAMQLIAQMKRDWMQTGRRPAGVCGAALWLACHIHGIQMGRKQIIKVVSIGESTLMTRISELRGTESSQLTVSEFKVQARRCLETQRRMEEDGEPAAPQQITDHEAPATELEVAHQSGALCRHVTLKHAAEFALGMCQECYKNYIRSSGGNFAGAADPPAYTRNLRKELIGMKRDAQREALRFITPQASSPRPSGASSPARPSTDSTTEAVQLQITSTAQTQAGPAAAQSQALQLGTAGEEPSGTGDAAAGSSGSARDGPSRGRGRRGRGRGGGRGLEREGERGVGHMDKAEAEFVYALLTNDSVREIAQLLRSSGADLPATTVQEAEEVLGDAAEASEAGAASGWRGVSPAGVGPSAATSLAVARFLQLQRGVGVELVSDAAAPLVTDETRRRAQVLSEQNAAPPVPTGKVKKKRKGTGNDTSGLVLSQEPNGTTDVVTTGDDDGEEDAEQEEEEAGAIVPAVPADTLSDIDDDEIGAYLATEEEAACKKQVWQAYNKEWLDKQAAKAAAAAEAPEPEKVEKPRKKRMRTLFEPGETAEASVLNMFEAKNMGARVNKDAIHEMFEAAEKLRDCEGQPAETEEHGFGEEIRRVQEATKREQTLRASKHAAALAREKGKGSDLDVLGGIAKAQNAKRPRLGRLK